MEDQSQDRRMWTIYIEGPDDIYAVPDKAVADAAALVLTRQCERLGLRVTVGVIEWPRSARQWRWEQNLRAAPQFQLSVVIRTNR